MNQPNLFAGNSSPISGSPAVPQPLSGPDYESKAEVARRLGVSIRTVDNMMRRRRLPFIRLTSKLVRFKKSDVDSYLAENLTIHAHQGRGGSAR